MRTRSRGISPDILSGADRRSFRALESALGGRCGLAVSAGGRVEHLGSVDAAVAWSTSKVPLAMAVIDRFGEEAYGHDVTAAITVSDNAAASRLWEALGGGEAAGRAVDEQLRAAGDERTVTQWQSLRDGFTPFGQTDWSLTQQVRFLAGMDRLPAGRRVLELMGHTAASEPWGLGAVGVPVRFKGGWGPGCQPGVPGGYLARQAGVLSLHGEPLVVAIASIPAEDSHERATANLTRIAAWVVEHADAHRLPAR